MVAQRGGVGGKFFPPWASEKSAYRGKLREKGEKMKKREKKKGKVKEKQYFGKSI